MPGSSKKVAIVTGAGAASAAPSLMLARKARASWSATSARSWTAPAATTGPAQEAVDEIKKAGGEAIASTLSIGEPENADEIVKAALDAFGRVDILVNNAGILRDVIFHRMSWSDWSDVIKVHLQRLVQHEPRGRRRISASRIRAPTCT